MAGIAATPEYYRRPSTHTVTGRRPVLLFRRGAASATMRTSTAVSAIALCALLGSAKAKADPCFFDPANGPIYIQTCTGTAGATGLIGPDGNGQNGGAGGAPGSGGYGFPQGFPGIAGKPTLAFSGVGGRGGNGGPAAKSTSLQRGGDGGRGGDGWDFSLGLSGRIDDGGNALTPISIISGGGAGGSGGFYGANNYGFGGAGGGGGDGGSVSFTLDPTGQVVSTGAGVSAVSLLSKGASGGDAQPAATQTFTSAKGAKGGAGGAGGAITATVSGVIRSAGAGLQAFSMGGNGGEGGAATSAVNSATGGDGGVGGNSGLINLTLAGASITATGAAAPATGTTQNGQGGNITFSAPVAAVQALTIGGIGAPGGTGDAQVGKGTGGSGGTVNATSPVTVTAQNITLSTSGYGGAGILAQSAGGHGGNGGFGGGTFVSVGGKGSAGGNAGLAQITSSGGSIQTIGDSSLALVAQSLGGGGGYGADATIAGAIIGIAVGGDSASGGNGGRAAIDNGISLTQPSPGAVGATIVTSGYKSAAILAQSIGGGGGIAGDARSQVGGLLSVAVGGNAGSGGDGGEASVFNSGALQTDGVGAHGAVAQSIGGGGGSGGAAAALVVGAQLTVSSAVGGKGGSGGVAAPAIVSQTGQIVTNGTDAFGIVAQSVGGGGGTGGTSVARNIQLFNASQAPSINLTVALGGSGGNGGSSQGATIINSGTVLTSGFGAIAVVGQSIGGGGGSGGDSNALSLLGKGSTVTVTTSIGGSGGSGGNAGSVEIDNSGFIGTIADHSTAVMAQSVGGGGGVGGYGNAASGSLADNDASLAEAIGVGGKGGAGGKGSLVTVNNKLGHIFTQGSNSFGIFAQSVGGGGGAGGGALANGGGGTKVNLNVGVGGSGGSGNDGGKIIVTNDAAIVTVGGAASAIYAQSVGGGGGVGGDAALGTGASPATSAADFVKQGLGIGAKTTTTPDGLVTQLEDIFSESKDIGEELKKILDAYKELNPSDPGKEKGTIAGQIDVNIGGGFSGKGGSGGDGLDVTITNSGSIETTGAYAEGIFAQSIGGGGGNGGAAAVTNDTSVINGTLGIGGRGGSSGDGHLVTVTNSGSIATGGDAAFGVSAQSIGGGGGKGGASVGKPGILSDFALNIGGSGGSHGAGGPITINQSGSIITAGRNAIGILAQSIGGGGGLGALMTINADNSGGTAASHTGYIINRAAATVNIGGAGGASGHGAAVNVNLNGGGISTAGIDAYGVLAQSIGGGGGLIIGVDGRADKTSADDAFGAGPFTGDGGTVTVTTTNGATIKTAGAGAVGILAQSIGGGGALIGGMANVDLTQPAKITTSKVITGTIISHVGSGGDISVNVGEHTSVTTTGARAHGIFVQAVGNGGGIYSHADGSGFTMAGLPQLICGVSGDEACTGHVSVDVTGDVHASGAGAHGLYVQNRGNGVGTRTTDARYAVDITLSGGEGLIRADGAGAAAIYIDSPQGKVRITNNGYLGGGSGIAIDGTGSAEIYNSVWIRGDILTSGANAGYAITNYSSGRIYTGKNIMSVGTFINQGELWLGTGAKNGTTIHSGLNSTGRLITGIDFVKGTADVLVVAGPANISGQIFVTPLSVKSAAVAVLLANPLRVGPVTVSDFQYNYDDDTLTPVTPLLYSYSVAQSGNLLRVAMKGQLSQPDGVLGANQDTLADHLQGLFDASTIGGEAVLDALLRNVTVAEDYQPALESLGPDALGSLALLQSQADRSFSAAMMSCDGGAARQAKAEERDCFWARGVYGDVDRGSTATELGYDATFSGFQIGGQHRLSDDWLIGGSLAYQDSDIDADRRRATLDGDGVDAGIFIKREKGPLVLAVALTGGRQWFDTQRLIDLGGLLAIAKASPDVSHIGWHGRVAYELGRGSWHLRPQLDLDATRIHVGGFTETGSPFALRVDGRTETQFSATPSLEVGGDWQLNSRLTLRPFARAGATINAGNDWHFVAGFASVDDQALKFVSRTTLPNTTAHVGAGLDLLGARGLGLRLQYDAELGRRYSAQQASLRLSYQF